MSTDDVTPPPPIEIPPGAVAEDLLRQIVEEFVLREGTDYGAAEVALSTKVEQVLRQIARGDVKVYFDPESESVTLTPKGPR